MHIKRDLGQFFTTNSDYILQGLEPFVAGKVVLDPFAGNGDLLRWAKDNGAKAVSGLDIDSELASQNTINDSLVSIPHASFNITNPPYLAGNRMTPEQKATYPMNGKEDLYLLAMKRIIESDPDEGIIIIPVNFFSAKNSDKLRVEFMSRYDIGRTNYFTEQVFEDTTYNVVAFHYARKVLPSTKQNIEIVSFPGGQSKIFELEAEYDYRIAGRALSKIAAAKRLEVIRLTEAHIAVQENCGRMEHPAMEKNAGQCKVKALFNNKNSSREYSIYSTYKDILDDNIILINCVDTKKYGRICAEDIRNTGYSCLVGKKSSRNNAYLILPEVSLEDQEKIIPMFNDELNALRDEYNSLFLTNFRENDRKQISFELCYQLISYCYERLYSSPLEAQEPRQPQSSS